MRTAAWKQKTFLRRRTQTSALACWMLVAIALSLLIASCRRDRVWSGVRYNHSGKTMMLSSAEPFCGCLEAINDSNQTIRLESRAHLPKSYPPVVVRGRVYLPPHTNMQARYDWTGPSADDVYEIDAFGPDGQQIILRDVLRIVGEGWPYTPCDTHVCKPGDLNMNYGEIHAQ